MNLKLKYQSFIGWLLYKLGVKPCYSTGIGGDLTVGYGELDNNGYWQYPTPRRD